MRVRLVEDEPGWGRGDSVVRPDLPMFWLALALALGGLGYTQALLGGIGSQKPGTVSLVLIIWVLYAVPLVAVVTGLDLHEPEPPAMLAAAFAWGALVAVPVAVVANTSVDSILATQLDPEVAADWFPALSGPVIEEWMKALGLLVLLALSRRQFTTVLDGFVYGAFIGLGFQLAENVVSTIVALRSPHSGTHATVAVHVLEVRGLGLGLWSHAVWTALVGAGVAYVVVRRRSGAGGGWRPWVVLGSCYLAATGLHFVWNAPWWQPDTTTFDAADMLTYMAKGLPGLLLVAALAVAARVREVAWFAQSLGARTEVTEAEIEALQTWRARRRARRAAHAAGGRQARRAVRRLQAAQVRLAVALATGASDERVAEAAGRIRCARDVAEAAGWSRLSESNRRPSHYE